MREARRTGQVLFESSSVLRARYITPHCIRRIRTQIPVCTVCTGVCRYRYGKKSELCYRLTNQVRRPSPFGCSIHPPSKLSSQKVPAFSVFRCRFPIPSSFLPPPAQAEAATVLDWHIGSAEYSYILDACPHHLSLIQHPEVQKFRIPEAQELIHPFEPSPTDNLPT